MRKQTYLLLLFLCALGLYVDDPSRITVPVWVLSGIESLLSDPQNEKDSEKDSEKTTGSPSTIATAAPVVQPQQVKAPHAIERYCKPSGLGAIDKSAGAQVYKWVDDKGKTHFGDQRSKSEVSETLTLDGQIQYFNLKIHVDKQGLPLAFRQDLTVRVNKAYNWLSTLLPRDLLQKVQVNLWVFNQQSGYEQFRKKHAPTLIGASRGFHSSKNNIAAAYRDTDEQLLHTSVHEAVHVMNAGMFGYIPRWLNEGIAEYLEALTVYGQAVEIKPMEGWVRTIKRQRLSIKSVITANRDGWSGNQINSLYAHSWGLVYFLMSTQDGQKLLNDYLVASSKSPCQVEDSYLYIQKNYKGGLNQLESNFNQWLQGTMLTQQY
ncbi:DUF4124 domain-containing protein [bacterium]|nr:DUF4124 domain-containing protein [bacterium]